MTRNTFPLQTIGLDWLWSSFALPSAVPGSGTFQRTFSASFPPQVSGRSLASVTPMPVGPRQEGQSAAGAGGERNARIARARRVRFTVRAPAGVRARRDGRATVRYARGRRFVAGAQLGEPFGAAATPPPLPCTQGRGRG